MHKKTQIVFENCTLCAIGPSLYFSSFIGLPSLKMSCTHRNSESQAIIRFSKRSLFVSLMIVTLILSPLISHICTKNFEFRVDSDITNMALVTLNAFLCLRAVTLIICCLITVNSAKRVFYGIDHFIKNTKINRCEVFMRKKDVKKLRGRSFLICTSAVSLITIYGLYLLQLKEWKPYYPFGRLPMLLCIYVEITFVVAFLAVLDVFIFLYMRLREQLEIEIAIESKSKIILCERLLKNLICIRNEHLAITKALKELNQFCNPLQVMWLIFSVIILIAHVYVTIVFFNRIEETSQFVGLELQIEVSSAFMVLGLEHLERLQVLVSDY